MLFPKSDRLLGFQAAQRAQQIETVQAGAMAVAEVESNGVVADPFPADDLDAGKLFRSVPPVLIAEDIAFALIRRAGRGGPQGFKIMIRFAAVVPDNRDFPADELKVYG